MRKTIFTYKQGAEVKACTLRGFWCVESLQNWAMRRNAKPVQARFFTQHEGWKAPICNDAMQMNWAH